MFGYVAANLNDLSDAEKARYQAAYCGLCRALKRRFGQSARMCLTYDMTFLALLLGSLYEPEEAHGKFRCTLHPLKPHEFASSEATDYAADLSVALAYHKCLDDWDDDRSVPAKAYAGVLAKPYARVAQRLPRQCAAIEQGMADIRAIEQDPASSPDDAARRFGAVLGQVFAWREDIWSAALRQFGEELGRFIYFMDAACDLEDDQRKGSYNPLAALQMSDQDTTEALTTFAARATAVFERLPLEQDLHLLRSVLYSGVWQKRAAQLAKKEKRARKSAGSSHADEATATAEGKAPPALAPRDAEQTRPAANDAAASAHEEKDA